ncbi:MAG TPA: hypothetical protein VKV35_12860 [Streptosporangiaceae bacterium]|jgi:hypothetical protein|nr:hypothetical protein [Streptosporangiaceae bacterium]
MDGPDVWVAKDDGTEIIRAREIAAVSLGYDGNVTARLAGGDAALVTLVRGRTHHDEHRPGDFHRELLRVVAQLSDSSGAHLVRPVHDESRGWLWVGEPV